MPGMAMSWMEVELDSGALSEPERLVAMRSGSWLVVHPELPLLYSSYSSDQGSGVAVLKYNAAGDL